jgi:diadenosine tetraphosphatase ApaH/serine/threonine PP2A family protein phosphatase
MEDTYKVAVLFDIHGNYHALKAVLEDAKTLNPDCYVFGGDLVSGAANSKKCIDEYKKLNAYGVLGNTDEKVVDKACQLTSWTSNQLSYEDIQILATLPICKRIHPPGINNPKDDLLIVHSTPRSCNDFLVLNPRKPGPTRSGQKTTDENIREMLNDEIFNTMLYGHIHYTSERIFEGQRLMSIIPVGLPEDNDVRAGYAIAQWKNGNWDITVRRVKYDYEGAAHFIEESSQPYRKRFAAMIRQAVYFSKSENGNEDN